jgi:hypothetical protein
MTGHGFPRAVFFFFAIALLAPLLGGCTTLRLELGAGYDKYVDAGGRDRSVIRVREERACGPSGWRCIGEYNHHSSFSRGRPFNDRPEDLTNQWSGVISIPLWGRP